MDDDLPKEGELLDISKKRAGELHQKVETAQVGGTPTKIPFGLLGILVLVALIAFFSSGMFGAKENPEKVATYAQGTQSIFGTMKNQFPYLVSIQCEGKDQNKADCVKYVGTFRPDKNNPNYLSSMDTVDKVQGVTDLDIEAIKGHVKVLADNKRMTLATRELFTFRIDSVTVPKVGEEYKVMIVCIEKGADAVECESMK